MCTKLLQSCPILCDSVDHSPSGSSVYAVLHASVLEWVAISFSRGSSWPRDQIQISCTAVILYHLSHQRSPLTYMIAFNFHNHLALFITTIPIIYINIWRCRSINSFPKITSINKGLKFQSRQAKFSSMFLKTTTYGFLYFPTLA